MLTPYDWQEGIGNRAEYVRTRLESGVPVIAVSAPEGVVLVTLHRQKRKLFEVYDHLAFAALGQQSDIEALRVAAVEFAHREGFQRSEDDVTLTRVVTAMSSPIKSSFADFNTVPLVVRSLFVEVANKPEDDQFCVLDFDGDYVFESELAVISGSADHQESLVESAKKFKSAKGTLAKRGEALAHTIRKAMGDRLEGEEWKTEIGLLRRPPGIPGTHLEHL